MLKNYLKLSFKVLLRRKFFTFISLFAISFTLLVIMTWTAILDNIIAPHPPETKFDRVLGIVHIEMAGPRARSSGNPGYGFLDKYVRGIERVDQFSIFTEGRTATSYKNGTEIKSILKRTDGPYWKILEYTFLEGRPLTDNDDKNANFVAIINRTTRSKFFGDQSALGKYIELDRQRFQVVGVVEDISVLRPISHADVWVPNSTSPNLSERDRLMGGYLALMLAHDRSDFELIKQEFRSRLSSVPMTNPDYERIDGTPETFLESVSRDMMPTGEANPTLFTTIIILAALLFMILPTLNLVNINISRILERSSEIGVRKSFGASSWTLVGQFIVENLILTFIGGVIGFLLSAFVLHQLNNSDLIPHANLQFNVRIFGYGMLMMIFFGFLSGVYPAWKMSRIHPVLALKGAIR